MLSATYRQASVADAAARERDPDNEWLARGPVHRLSAEEVRDAALAASGLLVPKIGGPSVYPYQPAGLWEALATRNATTYTRGKGDDLYRRSLYTVWKRSSPPPSAISFDAAERLVCTVNRQRTSTPLQALVLLNDPQFVEAARALGGADARATAARPSTPASPSPSRPHRPRARRTTSAPRSQRSIATSWRRFRSGPGRGGEAAAGRRRRRRRLASTRRNWPPSTVVASTVMNVDAAITKR